MPRFRESATLISADRKHRLASDLPIAIHETAILDEFGNPPGAQFDYPRAEILVSPSPYVEVGTILCVVRHGQNVCYRVNQVLNQRNYKFCYASGTEPPEAIPDFVQLYGPLYSEVYR